MAKIIDPDNLALTLSTQTSEEVVINTTNKTIRLTSAGTSSLDDDGVTGQCLYSFLKEEWRTNATLSKFSFPLISVTEECFELVEGWTWYDSTTVMFLRDCGFAVKDTSGVIQEEWMGVVSLGTFAAGTDHAYYQRAEGTTPTITHIAGEVNECVQIYGTATHGNCDYRDYFKIYLREQAKTYVAYDLVTEQALTSLTYKKYQVPLSNASDSVKITHSDATVSTTEPYTGITVTWHATNQSRLIGGVARNFNIIINGNGATLEQIKEKEAYLLRQASDIDSGAGTKIGNITDSLLTFVGDNLYCSTGVYIDNFQATDTNRLYPRDVTGVVRAFPYVSAGAIKFGINLKNDADAIYKIYFLNDDAGDNLGRDFGTVDAMIINDASGTPIAGNVDGNSTITFDYDFDANVQRGSSSAGTEVPYYAMAIGLSTGKYAYEIGTLTRSTQNVINLSAELERSYTNP